MSAGASVALTATGSSASIGSDRSTVSHLERVIEAQGLRVQTLDAEYSRVAAQVAVLRARLAGERRRLRVEQRSEEGALVRLRHVAIAAYVNASSAASTAFPSTANAATLPEQQVYMGVASGSLGSAATTLLLDQHRAQVTSSTLGKVESRDVLTLRALEGAYAAAQGATRSDETLLGHVKGSLLALVTAANARAQAAQERQSEARLAAAAQKGASQHATAPAPTPPTVQPSPGGYANPLRAVSGLSPERIDQGVDYSGFGPIYAVGDGTVVSTYNGGWPGGTYIAYQLTNGPAAGLVVYAAEDITPDVQVGESVTSATVLGQVYEGPDGIETGWANGGSGETMAATYGQFAGWNTTAFGANFSQLLQSLGAPGGVPQSAPSGSLPGGWPQW